MSAHRQIAPRLASGRRRDSLYSRLPPEIKAGLRSIARDERKSMSWVIEETIIRYFKLREPKYIETKPKLKIVRRRSA